MVPSSMRFRTRRPSMVRGLRQGPKRQDRRPHLRTVRPTPSVLATAFDGDLHAVLAPGEGGEK
uniref:Uncharacterized protein n=1 Tax=Arundo donax TaxID=35708 RepID=A0A0A8ZRD7_ARUDO